jgi:hypothetical protein
MLDNVYFDGTGSAHQATGESARLPSRSSTEEWERAMSPAAPSIDDRTSAMPGVREGRGLTASSLRVPERFANPARFCTPRRVGASRRSWLSWWPAVVWGACVGVLEASPEAAVMQRDPIGRARGGPEASLLFRGRSAAEAASGGVRQVHQCTGVRRGGCGFLAASH